MRVTISSSSRDEIDQIYKDEAERVCEYLASTGWDLNWGSGSHGIMGICYNVFNKYNRNIYGYTTRKYADEIDELPNAQHTIYDTTIELKDNFVKDADMLLVLAGGTGSVSEFFTYLEEVRSNDVDTPLILYNESHLFDSTIAVINDLISKKFNSESIFEYFKIANSFEEFKSIVDDIKKNDNKKL
ncbi:MAG: LOG family protein [Bacilli bacterium]|nr:LOG family protein [Bacilli bacterium]